jgi:hypothetical protein
MNSVEREAKEEVILRAAEFRPYGQVTVAELRALLALYPDDMPVNTEGCDCYGACDGVLENEGVLLLTRGHRE